MFLRIIEIIIYWVIILKVYMNNINVLLLWPFLHNWKSGEYCSISFCTFVLYIFMLYFCVVINTLNPMRRLILLYVWHIFDENQKKKVPPWDVQNWTNSFTIELLLFISKLFECKQVELYAVIIDAFASFQSLRMILSN